MASDSASPQTEFKKKKAITPLLQAEVFVCSEQRFQLYGYKKVKNFNIHLYVYEEIFEQALLLELLKKSVDGETFHRHEAE